MKTAITSVKIRRRREWDGFRAVKMRTEGGDLMLNKLIGVLRDPEINEVLVPRTLILELAEGYRRKSRLERTQRRMLGSIRRQFESATTALIDAKVLLLVIAQSAEKLSDWKNNRSAIRNIGEGVRAEVDNCLADNAATRSLKFFL